MDKGGLFFFVLAAIDVIDAEETTGEGADLSEGDEEGFVDLPKRGDIDAAKQHHETAE